MMLELGINGPEDEPDVPDDGYEPFDLTPIHETDLGPDTFAGE
jgi:hypothetical protein